MLRKGIRPVLAMQEIINRAGYLTDAEGKSAESAKEAIVAVITQTHFYMLQDDIEFDYLSTGEIYLFLHILYTRSEFVYYYLAEPNVDVKGVNPDKTLAYSAIRQVLCFCLRVLGSTRCSQ